MNDPIFRRSDITTLFFYSCSKFARKYMSRFADFGHNCTIKQTYVKTYMKIFLVGGNLPNTIRSLLNASSIKLLHFSGSSSRVSTDSCRRAISASIVYSSSRFLFNTPSARSHAFIHRHRVFLNFFKDCLITMVYFLLSAIRAIAAIRHVLLWRSNRSSMSLFKTSEVQTL